MAIRWKGLLSFKSKHWVIPRPIGIELLLSFYLQSRTGRACLLVHVNLWLVPSIQTAVLPTITNCETLPPRPRVNGWTSESFTKYMIVVSLVTWQQYGNRVLRILVIFSIILDNISTPSLFTCSRLLQCTFYFNHHKTQGKWQWFIYLNFSSLCDNGSEFLLNEIQYINTSGLWQLCGCHLPALCWHYWHSKELWATWGIFVQLYMWHIWRSFQNLQQQLHGKGIPTGSFGI